VTFLASQDSRPLSAPNEQRSVAAVGLFLGNGNMPLEIAVYRSPHEPTNAALRRMHSDRKGKRATPVLVVVLWGDDKAALAGPTEDDVAVAARMDRSQAERICAAALAAPDRHAAARLLSSALGQLGAAIPGLKNAGLFALHELEAGVPNRQDWPSSTTRASTLLDLRGRQLLEGLSFRIQQLAGPESLLVANGTDVAIAIFLERPDDIEPASAQFGNVSPVSHALAKADQKNLDYVVISAGSVLRVYPVKPGIGTGRRGRTETYAELNLDLLSPAQAGYLWLICSADALVPGGTFTDILARSADYAAELGGRLRERVYQEVVPRLAAALVKARRLRDPTPEKLAQTYEMTLLVLFRLLFLAYAEDKELLPLHLNAAYRKHSLKEMARQLGEAAARNQVFENEDFYWNEVRQLWKAVDKGNGNWSVPAYNGGLFAADESANDAGAALAKLSLPDSAFAPALQALLLDDTDEGTKGPIDFRSLGVREFGTIYEGLLESELSVAETDLAVDKSTQAYLPAKGKATVVVAEGEVYLHNASGARKSSGAYYTKPFAVEHLLDHALEPALAEHLARLDALVDDRARAERFFDFRVADIAMGSGHFLVAAIDRVERGLSSYLATRSLSGVIDELERLRKTATESLGADWCGDAIEDTQLLRRQIARRCIFGVDLNPLAVELARLSIWIHTFVPGLPLSFLDGNLVCGNSLVGIATFEEASELLVERSGSLFALTATERLNAARVPMEKLARLADATAAEVKEAGRLYAEARSRIRGEEHLLTALTASRMDKTIGERVAIELADASKNAQGDMFSDALVRRAGKQLNDLRPLHFPIAFPQVFLSRRPGFDVILGNPPWEEATVEEDAFWARHFPGLRSLSQREQETRKKTLRRQRPDLVAVLEAAIDKAERLRVALTSGPYPGMGTGDPDVYKAFCWRFWELIAHEGGRIGVVLPRSALAAKGTAAFRVRVFGYAPDVSITALLNTGGWVFDEAEHRYTIALVTIKRGSADRCVLTLRGPYANLARFRSGMVAEPATFSGSDVSAWNDTASLPLLPSDRSLEIFAKLRRAPRLDLDRRDAWRARPYSELHATNDKPLMDLTSETRPDGFWPVYKGESFDLWTPDTGTVYAWADPDRVLPALQEKRSRAAKKVGSPFSEFPKGWVTDSHTLPCRAPRIAFRDISRATDTRTLRAALIPPNVFLGNQAPYLLWPRGGAADQAFLLGVLCSIPLDWYARRFVETHVSFFVLNPLPIPRPPSNSPLFRRAAEISATLAAQNRRFADWAHPIGVKPRRLEEDEQNDLIAELDAAVAHLFEIAEGDLVHIFETFHEGWDYEARLKATLKHFAQLRRVAR